MTKRQWYGLSIFILSILLWFTRSDTLKLVVREREVLFNRYSEGHFAVLVIVTLLLWVIVACLWSKRALDRHLLADALTGIVTTVVTIVLTVYLTHWMTKPRYVEVKTSNTTDAVIIRHRPPNTQQSFTWEDKPAHARSYPNPPPGYGTITGTLTTDHHGFRNLGTPRDRYDIVAVGDSFTAGSHVSDEQVWTHLLAQHTNKSIYNLGVSGSAPITYLANYQHLAKQLSPSISIFVIYEGNDFKADGIPDTLQLNSPPAANNATPNVSHQQSTNAWSDFKAHIETAFKASPITRGLKELSRSYFEPAFANNDLYKYSRINHVMPMKVSYNGTTHFYTFDAKRLAYLFHTEESFSASKEWKATAKIIDAMAAHATHHGSLPLFIFVPSTPHVIMPLTEDLPATQLTRFLRYAQKKPTGSYEETKKAIYENLDSIENVFTQNCVAKQLQCLSLTPALQEAVKQGIQPYYSYDQHWTPEGNRIAAQAVAEFLTKVRQP